MSELKQKWQYVGQNYGFRVKIPQALATTFDPLDHNDPLTKQFIPNKLEDSNEGCIDPLEEHSLIQHGIIQKYKHRVLITTTGACAVHCRYCFRRHFPYEANSILKSLDQLAQFLQEHPDINEVILSGGDPLMLKNHHLETIFNVLKQSENIRIVRFHTRIPTVQPERIDIGFLNLIKQYSMFQWVIVTHINHANEFNQLNKQAIKKLRALKITLLNQSVLLKGINDSCDTLKELSLNLFNVGILPYYLHQLDTVKGAMHFAVDIDQGKRIIESLQAVLPGYLVPKYVQEQPGMPNKTTL